MCTGAMAHGVRKPRAIPIALRSSALGRSSCSSRCFLRRWADTGRALPLVPGGLLGQGRAREYGSPSAAINTRTTPSATDDKTGFLEPKHRATRGRGALLIGTQHG